MQAEIETQLITPKLAEYYLTKNKANRPIKKRIVIRENFPEAI